MYFGYQVAFGRFGEEVTGYGDLNNAISSARTVEELGVLEQLGQMFAVSMPEGLDATMLSNVMSQWKEFWTYPAMFAGVIAVVFFLLSGTRYRSRKRKVANNSDHRGKELLLVRHAKSSWDDPYLDDHDRPLNERGLRNAPEMGKRLQGRGILPEVWISSTALRAITTAEIIAEQIGFPQDQIQRSKDLYHASATELQEFIAGLDDAIGSAILFGHNPGMTSLVANLYGLPIDNLPTCGVVHLQFNENTWSAVSSAPPARAYFDFPKNESGEALRLI